jgi:uncharacterized membrane-anchored protein
MMKERPGEDGHRRRDMMNEDRKKANRMLYVVALLGIMLEAVAIYLLSAKRIETSVAIPLVIAGMFIAFVPIFAVARRARR